MVASVYSTLSGKLVGKHPTLGVLVSDDGKVLCPRRWVTIRRGVCKPTVWVWNPGSNRGDGYLRVTVNKKAYAVHRLVAETFLPNPEHKPTVDHRDKNRANNNLSNLKWATYHEQQVNTKRYENAKDYGVRECEDKNAYGKIYNKAAYSKNKQDPEWYAKFLKSCRESKERKRRRDGVPIKRKKAEQSALPSI